MNELNINMTNVLFGAIDIVSEAKQILSEIGRVFPNHHEGVTLAGSLTEYKSVLIETAIEQSEGNKTKAAKKLGIGREAMSMHCQKYRPELLKFKRA